jgi:hypothetical protein
VKETFFRSKGRILWSSLGLLALCAVLITAGTFAVTSASAAAPKQQTKAVLQVNPTDVGVPGLGTAHDCTFSPKNEMVCKTTLSAPKSNTVRLKWHYSVTVSDNSNLTSTTKITPASRMLAPGQHVALTITFGKFECSQGAATLGFVKFISSQGTTATLTIHCG